MSFNWDKSYKYLSFVYGSEWDKEDVKPFVYRKTPLGWDINIWRIAISYDNFRKVKPRG
jgi:hypothetical protein